MQEQRNDFRAVTGIFRRQWRLVAACLGFAILSTGLVLFWLTPVYTASTLILVDPSQKDLLSADEQAPAGGADSARVDGEVELVMATGTLLRTIDRLELVIDPEFGPTLGWRDRVFAALGLSDAAPPSGSAALRQVMQRISEAVSVRRRGLTYLMAIDARSQSPERAADIANTLAETYIADQVQAKVDRVLAARDILGTRIVEASAALSRSEESLDGFVLANLDRIVAETGQTRLLDLRVQLASANTARLQSMEAYEAVSAGLVQENWITLADRLQSDAIRQLDLQRLAVTGRLAAAVDDPARNGSLRQELAVIEQRLRAEAASGQSRLQRQIGEATGLATDVRARMLEAASTANLPADMLAAVYELQQNAAIARAQYQTLLGRLRDLETRAELQVADSRIVSPALPPGAPSFPNARLMLALAAMIGLGAGAGLAFLYEFHFGGFTSAEQAEAVLQRRVQSVVPTDTAKGPEGSLSPADRLIVAPLSAFAESVRRICAGLGRATRTAAQSGKPGLLAVITSSLPGEGKSTIALSLARACSQVGQKVLLIDADLRRPGLGALLGIEPKGSLFSFLSAPFEGALADIISRDPATGLAVILGDVPSAVPTDQLIAGPRFAALLDSARRHFDVVILDTPPVLPVVDVVYLTAVADLAFLIIRWGTTPQSEVRAALARIEETRASGAPVAIVINRDDTARASYYHID